MARDAQTETVNGEYIQLDGGGVGVLPYALMSFRGSVTLDGSGASDTADCRISLPLPSNNVWQMDTFAFYVTNTTGYTNGTFELYFNPSSSEFGQSTQIDYPLFPSIPVVNTGAGNVYSISYGLGIPGYTLAGGGQARQGLVVSDRLSPFGLLSYNDESAGADPTIWISSATSTNVGSGTARLAVTFKGYTFDQANSALLRAGLSNRS